MRPPSRPGPCCARDGLPKCIGDSCSHCPECGEHRFAAADGRCLTCVPVIGALEAKAKPRGGRKSSPEPVAPSNVGTLLEHVANPEYVEPDTEREYKVATEGDLVRGRVLVCLDCGSVVDHSGSGNGVLCATPGCKGWATKRGAAVTAHVQYGTPLPAGVVMPPMRDHVGGEDDAPDPGKPGADDADATTVGAVASADVPPLEFEPLPPIEFERLEPALEHALDTGGVVHTTLDDRGPHEVRVSGPSGIEWIRCPGGCGTLKDAAKLEDCRTCGDIRPLDPFPKRDPHDAALRVVEDRPGITGLSSPRTSVAAAMAVPTGKRRVQVLTTIARSREGRTTEELEAETSLGGSTIRPRLLELERDGFLERTERTRPTRSGMQAVVWDCTPLGVSAADRLMGAPAGMP